MDRLTGCFAAKTTRYTTLVVMSLLFCSRLVFAQSDSIKNQIKADTIALKKLERLNDQAGIVNSCLHIALSYYQLGEFNAHVQYAQRAFDLSKKIGDKKLMAVALVRLGSGYIYISDYPRALNCFLQQLKLLENTGDKLNTAKAQGNIGLIYYYLKNYPEALAYSNKCLHALQQLNDKVWVAASLNNIGGIYLEMGDYANAIVYNMKAIQINTQIRSAKGIGNDLMDIGVAYYKQHDFIKAYQYMRRSEAIYDSLGAKNNMAITLGHLALIYTYAPDSALVVMAIKPSQRFAKAVQLQQQAIALAGITKSRITEADQWKNLTLIYERQQNYKAAFKSLNKYNALKDSIFNDKKRNELSRLYIAYEFDKKAAELRAENAEKKIEVSRQKAIKNGAIFIGICLFISAWVSFIFYKRRKDAQEKQTGAEYKARVAETEMKALRSQLNPHFIFNSLNSISEYIARNDKETADIYLVRFARLMRLIFENSQHQNISLASDLAVLELYIQLEALRMGHKLKYSIELDEDLDPEFTLVPPMLLQPFVENSIWHGISPKSDGGNIIIRVKKTADMIEYVVEDNGIGRERSAALKQNSNLPSRESSGIKVIRSRIDIINDARKTNARVTFTDMPDGTKVSIILPYDLKF